MNIGLRLRAFKARFDRTESDDRQRARRAGNHHIELTQALR